MPSTHEAGHGAQHAGFGAIADYAIARCLRPNTAQATATGAYYLHLAFVLVHACQHGRYAMAHGRIVDGELHGQAIRAVDHHVVTRHQRVKQGGICGFRMRVQPDGRVQGAQACSQQQHFGLPAICRGIGNLPVQVGGLENVRVHQGQRTDARTGQISSDRYAETAAADDQHLRSAKLRLACSAHFR